MADSPVTRPSLLVRLRDADDDSAWAEFVSLYEPLIYRFGRKRGLQDADAADLTQVVLQAVSKAIKTMDYDRKQGTFRGWLYAIVRNQLYKLLEKQKLHGQIVSETAMNELAAEPAENENEESAIWEQEYKQQRFLWASERVKQDVEKNSWQSFWLTAVEGKSAGETAKTLGLSIGAVYTAKSRVLARIRKEIQQLEED